MKEDEGGEKQESLCFLPSSSVGTARTSAREIKDRGTLHRADGEVVDVVSFEDARSSRPRAARKERRIEACSSSEHSKQSKARSRYYSMSGKTSANENPPSRKYPNEGDLTISVFLFRKRFDTKPYNVHT